MDITNSLSFRSRKQPDGRKSDLHEVTHRTRFPGLFYPECQNCIWTADKGGPIRAEFSRITSEPNDRRISHIVWRGLNEFAILTKDECDSAKFYVKAKHKSVSDP